MKNKKVAAGVLTASMLAPVAAQLAPVAVMAVDARENAEHILYNGNRDCRTGDEIEQGLSLIIQDNMDGYKSVGVKIYKLPDEAEFSGDNKGGAMVDGAKADDYDLSKATEVASIHTITFADKIWTNDDGSVVEYDGTGVGATGKPTYIALSAGKYLVVYDDEEAGFGSGDKYQRVPFIVGDDKSTDTHNAMVDGKIASLDIECVQTIAPPVAELGSAQVQAVVVETDESGNPIKGEDGNFVLTGEKVPGVVVETKMTVMGVEVPGVTFTTDDNGEDLAENLPTGEYPATVNIPEGWTMADPDNDTTFSFDVKAGESAVHVIELYKTPEKDNDETDKPTEIPQAIRVVVVDKETGAEVEGAGFTVTAKNNPDFRFDGTSVTGGVNKTSVLVDTYTGSLTSVPDGYKMNTETVSVTLEPVTEEGKVTEIKLVIEKGEAVGALRAKVRDKNTKAPIPNATVQIVSPDGSVIDTIKTDENGSVSKGDLPAGEYTLKVSDVPEGYTSPEDQVANVEVNKVAENLFEIEKGKGILDVIVRDKDTKEPIPGAVVVIKDKDGNIIDTITTDEDGKVNKPDLPEGDYTVEVIEVPEGYTPPEPQNVTIEKDKTSELIFEVEKGRGNLDVIVRDKNTKNPIPNAKVEILDKDGKVILTTTTDKDGRVKKEDLPVGDYTIKVTEVPEGYTKPDNQTATVKKNETTQVIFELEKGKGALNVLIRDKDTKEPIPDAKVQILDETGKVILETKTNKDGRVEKNELPAGNYTIKVIEVPDGYSKPADTVAPVKVGKRTNVIFELEKGRGNLEVTIRDKDTKKPIPGAVVQIADKNGTLITTLTTDSNGQIKKENLPVGDYIIRVQEVPEGYKIPDNEKATVKKNETAKVLIELEKGVGALEVIVRDKDTKEPIPGAKVQILDESGKVIQETTTDSNGRVQKDKLPTGKYTIKVTEVPDGYKAPNDQDVTIKRSVKTTVIFELEKVKKPIIPSNIVQTGDNNNIFGLIGAGIASVAGMIFVSKKHKKDE